MNRNTETHRILLKRLLVGASSLMLACTSSGSSGGGGGNSGESGAGGSETAQGGSASGGSPEGGSAAGGATATGGTPASGGTTGTGGSTAGTGGSVSASSWKNVTGNLARMPSECGNLTMLSANPTTNQVIAGVAKVGLFSTVDGGAVWTKLGSGAGSASIVNRASSIVYDPLDSNIFYESGIYNSGGTYKTTDAGVTFKQLGNLTHNDLISVDFSDPDRKTILVGTHEQKQKLFLSKDGGATFTDIGPNLPADSHFSTAPLVLNATTFLVGECGYGAGKCGVYRSTDTGLTWTRTTDLAATARPLLAKDGAIYWPLIYDGGLIKSTDQGITWVRSGTGLITSPPIELPDGRIVAPNRTRLQITADGGKTWKAIGNALPFPPAGAVYSVATKTFFVWQWDCKNIVLANAIASAEWDYTAN